MVGVSLLDPSKKYDVKVISLQNLNSNELDLIKKYLHILKTVQHAQLQNLEYAIQTSRFLYLFFEYCEGGTLSDLLKHPTNISIEIIQEILKQIVIAYSNLMECTHYIHRNLKPENILFKDGKIKLASSAVSKLISSEKHLIDPILHSYAGTPAYMAPEIFQKQPYSNKCDVWSLGVILQQMLYGNLNCDASNLEKMIKAHEVIIPDDPQVVPTYFKELLNSMLQFDLEKRISWRELIQTPICQSETKTDILKQFLQQKSDTKQKCCLNNEKYSLVDEIVNNQ